jgi:(R,R)-butanediol dehydrogenase/meso-butanediol dehydrogenase/diacetyl reductase
MMADGKFHAEPLITGRIPLTENVSGGLEVLVKNKDAHAKILVSPV